MFDTVKDIDKYKGVPPYASELYGVYQPLLGTELIRNNSTADFAWTHLIDPDTDKL